MQYLDTESFFFPHFGSDPVAFYQAQQHLWARQLAFIHRVAQHYEGRIEQPPEAGGSEFLRSYYPESWWWAHSADIVNAITLETTYGRAGYEHWILESDLRFLGEAVARAIDDMNFPQISAESFQRNSVMPLFRAPFKPEIYLHPAE